LEPKTTTGNAGNPSKIKAPAIFLWRYVALVVAAWTVVVIIFLAGTLRQEHQTILEIARTEARSHIEQIVLYRQWNSLHNGIYVQVDDNTPPNPYLATLPERDLRTPSGKKLTMVNPAYMTRLLYELAQRQNKVEGRIISLKPMRPENTPDFWENKALKALELGAPEFSAVEHMPDQDYLRMIQPLVVEKACLECHAAQGYKLGDIRGGISVLVPLAPLHGANRDHVSMIWLSHGFFWLLGLGGIALASTRLGRSLAKQKRAELDLQEANQTLEALIKSAPLAIVVLDVKGSLLLWNPAAERIFGWRASEVVGQPPPFLPDDPPEDFHELYTRGLQGEPVRVVGGCSHRNGMTMDISFSMSPLFGPQEELTGVMAVLEDITERRQTQEELFQVNENLKVWILEFGRRNRDITLLNEMGDLLQACQTVEEAYAGVGQYVRRMFPEDSGALFIFNQGNNVLEAVTNWGKITPGALAFPPDECWALRMGQEHLVKDPASELVCGHLAGAVSTGSLCVPMIAHNENLGLLLLIKNPQEASADEPQSDSRERLATTAARQIALSLANLNLKNFLMQQAIHDPLTGLFNRRYMEETLEREIFRVQRKEASLGIIMLDLDSFKRHNDSLGHEAGDTLLQAMGTFLRTNIRREDIACRYGGDEFVLILPEASLKITRQRAEKLRQEVQRLQVDYRGQPLGPLTISAGVAVFPSHGDRVDAVLQAADAALYQAKEGGRNRVVTATEARIASV
jgi:diguanylate cyclase (GGDEF)-like protein/PAS domain S-box-containing protein